MTPTEAFETLMPNPWAYISDGPEGKLQASRLQWSAQHQLVHSTAPVYSHAQMRAMFDAATERAAKQEWQTIESAPKRTEVLVWREDSGSFIAKLTTPDAVLSERELEHAEFPEDFEEWFSDAYGWQEGSEKPTHWRPLDEPSAAAIRAREDGVAG